VEEHGVDDVRQAEVHTAEPLVPEPSAFEVEVAVEKLKRHKSPGTDRIPAELIKAGGRTIQGAIHKLRMERNYYVRFVKHNQLAMEQYMYCNIFILLYATCFGLIIMAIFRHYVIELIEENYLTCVGFC
jgi:hypothetical protein